MLIWISETKNERKKYENTSTLLRQLIITRVNYMHRDLVSFHKWNSLVVIASFRKTLFIARWSTLIMKIMIESITVAYGMGLFLLSPSFSLFVPLAPFFVWYREKFAHEFLFSMMHWPLVALLWTNVNSSSSATLTCRYAGVTCKSLHRNWSIRAARKTLSTFPLKKVTAK